MISYERLGITVEHFICETETWKDRSCEFDTGIGTSKLIYIKNGNKEYKELLDSMFWRKNVYSWHSNSDFILFQLEGKSLAAGIYTSDDISIQIDDIDDFIIVISNEL